MTPGDRADGGGRRPLTPQDLSCLEELSGAALSPDGRWLAYVQLTVDDEAPRNRFSLDLRSGALSPLRWPSDEAWLLHLAPDHGTAVHFASDRTGARLWISRPAFEQSARSPRRTRGCRTSHRPSCAASSTAGSEGTSSPAG